MASAPFFSIISVTRNDAWSLTKTARSVFRQSFKDFEYIIVDGASSDGTQGLIEFWSASGLVSKHLSEPDSGVYNAMNKGIHLANGQFLCYLNAGDVFAHDEVLAKVHQILASAPCDGLLGWGELAGQVWASWVASEAFKLASLGFCHQALFVKKTLLEAHPFDERAFKTDSDTLQLSQLYATGAKIPILKEVLAVRGIEPGISADLERTKTSIVNTLLEQYPHLDTLTAEGILAFRRQCLEPASVVALLDRSPDPLRAHLALMTLDTLFLRQSKKLDNEAVNSLFDKSHAAILSTSSPLLKGAVRDLLQAQELKAIFLETRASDAAALKQQIREFEEQELTRLAKLKFPPERQRGNFVVSLTSFPARIPTLHLVIQSLVEQTCPPREIHVWLGADEVPHRNWLPRALLKFEQHGLQIHFAPRTLHQYDKFMHNAELNRDMPFVIVDDDVIYPPTSMATLLAGHRAHPDAVLANRCHMMAVASDGDIDSYSKWSREIQVPGPRLRAFPTGAGGVLYPPGFLADPMVRNLGDALAYAPYADDVWLKMCALARGIPTMSTSLSKGANWYLRYTPTMRAGALHATNVELGLNDLQLQRSAAWLSRKRPQWRRELLAEDGQQS